MERHKFRRAVSIKIRVQRLLRVLFIPPHVVHVGDLTVVVNDRSRRTG